MAADCILVPVIFGVLVKIRFKFSKVGFAMLISLLLSFSAQFYLSLHQTGLLKIFTNDIFREIAFAIFVIL